MSTEQTDNDFGASILGTDFGIVGNEYQFKDWGLPFIEEINSLLAEAGYNKARNETAEIDVKERGSRPMALGVEGFKFIEFVIFIGQEAGGWLIGKICDVLYKAIKSKLADKGYPGGFGIQIKTDSLNLAVSGPVGSIEEARIFVDAIAEAYRKVEAMKQPFSKTTNLTLVYKIKDGKLPDEPIIID